MAVQCMEEDTRGIPVHIYMYVFCVLFSCRYIFHYEFPIPFRNALYQNGLYAVGTHEESLEVQWAAVRADGCTHMLECRAQLESMHRCRTREGAAQVANGFLCQPRMGIARAAFTFETSASTGGAYSGAADSGAGGAADSGANGAGGAAESRASGCPLYAVVVNDPGMEVLAGVDNLGPQQFLGMCTYLQYSKPFPL